MRSKTKPFFLVVAFFMLVTGSDAAVAGPEPPQKYLVDDAYVDLVIPELTLNSTTYCPNQFYEHIGFKSSKRPTAPIYIKMSFVKKSGSVLPNCRYQGNIMTDVAGVTHVTDSERVEFKSIFYRNYRSYWDDMYLATIANTNQPTSLTFSPFKIRFCNDYSDNCKLRQYNCCVNIYDNPNAGENEKWWTISGLYTNSPPLGIAGSEFGLSNRLIRACAACEWLKTNVITNYPGCDYTPASINTCVQDLENKFPRSWVTEFMFDLGKYGSDDDSLVNPKYGDDGALCTEAVSWYFANYANSSPSNSAWYSNKLRDTTNWGQIRDVFLNDNRVYCYKRASGKIPAAWNKCTYIDFDTNSCWSWGSATTTPMKGDVAVWSWRKNIALNPVRGPEPIYELNGHTMMVVDWRAAGTQPGKNLYIMEGPGPIGFRKVIATELDNPDYLFCIGRIPDNGFN